MSCFKRVVPFSLFCWPRLFPIITGQYGFKGLDRRKQKTGNGKYELLFNLPDVQGWQLYAPNQSPGDVKTVEMIFTDAAIKQEGDFILTVQPVTIKSSIFETDLAVFDKSASWKVKIAVSGTVPARLQGTMLYTYGKGEEYNPSTVLSFNVPLEGGVASSWSPKLASIDLAKPVNNCGDEGTTGKSIASIFLLGLLGGLIALLTPVYSR
ncbi:MAG: hypothetical protein IPG86_16665 [Chitinophagaceae bacterium]|nr:hypothetical protein [Chitinophagaceae bacterium]